MAESNSNTTNTNVGVSNTTSSTSNPRRISRRTIEAYKAGCLCMAYGDHEFGERIRQQEENDRLTGYDNTNEPRSDSEEEDYSSEDDSKPEENPNSKPEENPNSKPEENHNSKPEENPNSKPEENPNSKPEENPNPASKKDSKKPRRIHPVEIKAFRSGCACFPNHEASAAFAAQIKAQEEKDKLKGYDPADYATESDDELV